MFEDCWFEQKEKMELCWLVSGGVDLAGPVSRGPGRSGLFRRSAQSAQNPVFGS